MLTFGELCETLKCRYTPEELVDVIGANEDDVVDNLEGLIKDNYEEIHQRLQEDGFIEEVY